jgi:LEA14-like dessication related protein
MACKTQQAAGPDFLPEASAVLKFERIEAFSIDQFALHYRLEIDNPQNQAMFVEIKDRKGSLNKIELTPDSASLTLDTEPALGAGFITDPASLAEKKLVLNLKVDDIPSVKNDEYIANLVLILDFRYGDNAPFTCEVAANAVFPRIREPRFQIVSIAIIQADLINTKFKANIRVDNPNSFPVNLSSISYDLYGQGIHWASGRETDILHIPSKSSCETDFRFSMNFINMSRRLLDDIIAMRQVSYRFTGKAEVETGIDWLPSFKMIYERSGDSDVLK